jgi:hypothetical protein
VSSSAVAVTLTPAGRLRGVRSTDRDGGLVEKGEGQDDLGRAADAVRSASTEITWERAARIAVVRYAPDTTLTAADGAFLVDALTGWIGAEGEPFDVLADGTGVRGTDAAYRSKASAFFKGHRDTARIAMMNMSPFLRLLVDMFRIGTGIPLKGFADEPAARAWLATRSTTS